MESKTAVETSHKRPFIIWVLCILLGSLVLMGWVRVQQAIQSWDLVASLVSQLFPVYLVISGTIWGLAALPAVAGLLFKFKRARTFTWGAAIFYPLSYWLEKAILVKSPTGSTNTVFDTGVTILWFVFVGISLYLPASQAYLKGEN